MKRMSDLQKGNILRKSNIKATLRAEVDSTLDMASLFPSYPGNHDYHNLIMAANYLKKVIEDLNEKE